MSKDSQYFSHDYNARNDGKIKSLLAKHGYLGYGLFWAIVEDLYNNANAMPLNYDAIAYDLRTDIETIKSILNDFGLFQISNKIISSTSVQWRLDIRNEKSQKARQSANSRWSKRKEDNANAMRTQCDGNAIKESILKDSSIITPTWRDDFEIYRKEAEEAYLFLSSDKEFIKEREEFYPGIDIPLSLKLAYTDFWGKPEGWKKKKSSKSKTLDWRSTYSKALGINKVWKQKGANNDSGETAPQPPRLKPVTKW